MESCCTYCAGGAGGGVGGSYHQTMRALSEDRGRRARQPRRRRARARRARRAARARATAAAARATAAAAAHGHLHDNDQLLHEVASRQIADSKIAEHARRRRLAHHDAAPCDRGLLLQIDEAAHVVAPNYVPCSSRQRPSRAQAPHSSVDCGLSSGLSGAGSDFLAGSTSGFAVSRGARPPPRRIIARDSAATLCSAGRFRSFIRLCAPTRVSARRASARHLPRGPRRGRDIAFARPSPAGLGPGVCWTPGPRKSDRVEVFHDVHKSPPPQDSARRCHVSRSRAVPRRSGAQALARRRRAAGNTP